ncbi:MAG: hypothetical protein EOO78_20440 [Oxalobacteraceae bacterium]|nr:MAG: hypothetical protein EOO78_20440 [Oxalobacteraceae bacterium]
MTVAAQAASIQRVHGVRVGFGDPAGFYVPPYAPADAAIANATMTPAAVANLGPALDGVAESLALYPAGFYARFCRAVFLCGTLRFEGVRAGGTYGPAWIILAADPVVGPAGIHETARLGIHHEFSSLILLRFPRLEAEWAMLLPPGWRAIETTGGALGQTAAANGHDGFLSAYAATSVENDFNTYAETAFGDPARLLALAGRFEVVRRKASLLLGAFVALDTRMETAFRHLGLQELPIERPAASVIIPVPSHLPQPVLGRD